MTAAAAGENDNNGDEIQMDEQFRQRVQQSFVTVQAWENNEELLRRCREELVPDAFYNNNKKKKTEREAVQILVQHFQTKVMTWVNHPLCENCGGTTTAAADHNVRHVTTTTGMPLDADGAMCRVEVYRCKTCDQLLEFPRYNSIVRLLQSRQGRCGEYANLFGCLCRAVGLETRYILDFTDHVWTEVNLSGEWVHVDSCEGVVGENSMYEAGWGKKLSYVLAFTPHHVTDVTARYTSCCQQWHNNNNNNNDGDLLARRRTVTSSEEAGTTILRQINHAMAATLPAQERDRVQQQAQMEERQLLLLAEPMAPRSWDHLYRRGRISGSHAWKVSRQETGGGGGDSGESTTAPSTLSSSSSSTIVKFHTEPFYPARPTLEVILRPNKREIVVNGTSCAVGLHDAVSVVVLDETILGLVLQSQCFTCMADLSEFIATLPTGRIVAMIADKKEEEQQKTATTATTTTAAIEPFILKEFAKLGGFDTTALNHSFVFFGQMKLTPDWSRCFKTIALSKDDDGDSGDDKEYIFSCAQHNITLPERSLRTLKCCRPSKVLCRLPEAVMPLQTQSLASFAQKDIAVRSFLSQHSAYYGYTTKQGSPVYLLGAHSYPFVSKTGEEWHSFISLPKKLVPDFDKGIVESNKNENPLFEVPLDVSKFEHLGPYLLKTPTEGLGTAKALYNCRLVGLYFSAHWCGPCRSFTPMLCEMYEVLKEAFPSHGLEIVFVSGDRNTSEFEQYFATMPWLAIPGFHNHLLSAMYQVQGIPSLVILDAVSGQVVVSNNVARKEVHNACQRGEGSICDMFRGWLQNNVPAETIELLALLESSCCESSSVDVAEEDVISETYLTSTDYQLQLKARESLIAELMEDGLDRGEATEAARAVERVSTDDGGGGESTKAHHPNEPGSLNGAFTVQVQSMAKEEERVVVATLANKICECYDPAVIIGSLETARKYLTNCMKAPHSFRFRKIDLSFKVVDAKIGRVEGAVDVLEALGLQNEIYGDSYMLYIPVHTDLTRLDSDIGQLMGELRKM